MARGVWTGSITFGLVSVGVKALTAVHDHDVHFHQIEKGTGSRIGNQKVSKATGEPVESDDIELGYEISKERYVCSTRRRSMSCARPRVLAVTDFVDLASIDHVYFERTYWLAQTDEGDDLSYALLAAAMEQSQQVGIGTVVMRNKQYLTAVRPLHGALAMSTLRFADEVVDIDDIDEIPQDAASPTKKEMALAMQIIDSLATTWDPQRYEDTFTDELVGLIEAKAKGDEIVAEPMTEPEDGKVLDLMEALRASVDEAPGRPRQQRSTTAKGRQRSGPRRRRLRRRAAASKKAPAASRARARRRDEEARSQERVGAASDRTTRYAPPMPLVPDRSLRLAAASVRDHRELARRRLPRQLFDYIDGGAYEESTLRANESDLAAIGLRQRVLRDVSDISVSTTVLGRELTMPVLLAPVGLAGMFARRAEVQAARAAERFGVPFCESTVSICRRRGRCGHHSLLVPAVRDARPVLRRGVDGPGDRCGVRRWC
jgi:DNA end-binding protein Ku